MWDELLNYCSKLYCPSIAKYAVPPLIYSGILTKFLKYEDVNEFRYRLNIMLHWDFGFFKSALLKKVTSWFPLQANVLSTASSAALRGSFVHGKFYPPELLISDILVITEFQSILNADDAMLGQLLVALEEGDMRIALVKAGKVSSSEINEIERYGAQFKEGRLIYQNHAPIWSATHTIDNLPDHSRQAVLSRFFICHIKRKEIPDSSATKDYTKYIDSALENEIMQWLYNVKEQDSKPDHKFTQRVIENMVNRNYLPRMTPREVGDIKRMILAHHEIFPHDTYSEVAKKMVPFVEQKGILTTSELIAQTIYQNPTTVKVLQEITGRTKSTVFGHLKRLGARYVNGTFPREYYLDSYKKEEVGFSKELINIFSKKEDTEVKGEK